MAEKIFGSIIPILSDEEYNNSQSAVWMRKNSGDTISALQIIHYIASHLKSEAVLPILNYEASALGSGNDLTRAAIAEIGLIIEERLAAIRNPGSNTILNKTASTAVYTDDGEEPNAVLVYANGGAKLIRLKGFVGSDELGEPLDCGRVDMVLNRIPEWSERKFGIKLVGYVNSNGMPERLDENERIQAISGYDYIAGDCVLLGIDDKYNYLPLNARDAVTVWEYFKNRT